MEHLPIPPDCIQNVEVFEYFDCRLTYDRKGFAGFLERAGSSEGQLRDEIKSMSTATQPSVSKEELSNRSKYLAGLVQEWCWFGLLHELELHCGQPMNPSDFIGRSHIDPSVKVLSTVWLPDYVRKIQEHQRPGNAERGASSRTTAQVPAQEHRPSKDGTSLSDCIKVIESLTSDVAYNQLVHPIGPTFSYVCLLSEAVISILNKVLGETTHVPWRHVFPTPRQWCPSRCNYFGMVETPALRVITNSLPSFSLPGENHKRQCDRTRCEYHHHKISLVEPLHTNECNRMDCTTNVVDSQVLIGILLRGGNPGYKIEDDVKRTISFEDISGKDYVAISHVWAHGLGNAAQNALPWCQIRKIAALVHDLRGPETAIWIDTLSVPANPEHKHLAIAKLRRIYRDAKAVLVLDKHLQQVESDRFGRSLQLLGSEWMTRLWTLQEGKLAQNLFVQFRGGSVHISDLLDPFAGQDMRAGKLIFVGADKVRDLLRDLFAEQENITHRILQTAISLCNRNVSIATDEPICLATLLGLDLENFASNPSMADVYRAFPDHLPEDIAFFNGERLSEHGLRWAPASLLHQPKIRVWTYGKAKLDTRGLFVEKDLIRIRAKSDDTTIPMSDATWYSTQPIINSERIAFAIVSQPSRPLPELQQAALLLHTPGNSSPASSRAILVQVDREENDTAFCRFLANAQTARGNRIAFASRYLWKAQVKQEVLGSLQSRQRVCID